MVTKFQTLKYCMICMICILCIVYIFIYYGHNATCYLHHNLCTPWSKWLKKLRKPYDAITIQEFNEIMHDMWNGNIWETLACKNSLFSHDSNDKPKIGILFSQRHGGSNWIISELNKYNINVYKELLINWENNKCSSYSKYMEFTDCNEISLINALDEIYSNYMIKYKIYGYDFNFMFWKIQIGQIPPYLFKTLIDYIYCHNIQILHIIRQASVASFWSIQAQTIERIYSMDLEKILSLSHHSLIPLDRNEHIKALELDPYLTAQYVKNIDTNRKMFSKLIKIYPKSIKYQQYDYEDLIGPYSQSYWTSILYWIGGPLLMKKNKQKLNSNLTREHPMPCFTKISNWNQIKHVLKGTDSYFACEKYYS